MASWLNVMAYKCVEQPVIRGETGYLQNRRIPDNGFPTENDSHLIHLQLKVVRIREGIRWASGSSEI